MSDPSMPYEWAALPFYALRVGGLRPSFTPLDTPRHSPMPTIIVVLGRHGRPHFLCSGLQLLPHYRHRVFLMPLIQQRQDLVLGPTLCRAVEVDAMIRMMLRGHNDMPCGLPIPAGLSAYRANLVFSVTID
jgi:hypothetical protein